MPRRGCRAQASGLPLDARFVIEDILAGNYRVEELDRLPPTLNAYIFRSRRGEFD